MMIVLAGGLFVVSFFSNDFSWWLRVPIKLVLIALFPLILYWFGFYEAIELNRLQGFWVKWRNPATWAKNLRELKF